MKAGDGFAPQGAPAASRVRVVPAAALSPEGLECPHSTGAGAGQFSLCGGSAQPGPCAVLQGAGQSRAWGQ